MHGCIKIMAYVTYLFEIPRITVKLRFYLKGTVCVRCVCARVSVCECVVWKRVATHADAHDMRASVSKRILDLEM